MRFPPESGITFDLPTSALPKHDVLNRVFPGVDFVFEDPTRWIWLEVKNWEPYWLPAKDRGGQRRSFLSKMRGPTFFRDELRGKFLGTATYLALTGAFPAKEILYVILLESPRFDTALMLHATNRMKSLVPNLSTWTVQVHVVVVDLVEWNRRFPAYPATV